MRMLLARVQFLPLIMCGVICAQAVAETSQRSVQIVGRESATDTTDSVRLSDIAEVSSARISDDEIVIGLKKIVVAGSPLPGQEMLLEASQVLEKLKQNAVKLDDIGYTLPRSMKVTRAARIITHNELFAAVSDYLKNSGRDAVLRSLRYNEDQKVAPGDVSFEMVPYETSDSRRLGFSITAGVKGAPSTRFDAEAEIDQWREIPVASRALPKGSVVGPDDVVMARMNLAALSRDVARERGSILGMELGRNIGYGEPFTRGKLAIPPIIVSGSKVTMMYHGRHFEATATGIALESGLQDQTIKVRNDSSKKTVTGTVLATGLVEVKQ